MNNKTESISLFLLLLALLINPLISLAANVYTGTINADKVFFRTAANTSSSYHAKLNKGETVAVLGVKGDFYKVKFDSKDGYVMKKFVNLSKADYDKLNKNPSKYESIKTIAKLGTPPGALKKGDSGDSVEKLQRALQIKKFMTDEIDGKYGDITKSAVQKYQKANGLNATGTADTSTINHLFGVTNETTAKNDPKMAGITSIASITVPNTTKPGNSGKHVVALQQALKLKGYYKPAIDGKYGEGTKSAVTAFQKAAKLTADGIAGNGTIKALFGKNAANYSIPVEKVDWFKGGSSIIPKNAIFTIKDVWSGKTFSAKRWSGYNHIDAEPLNAKATETMKDIYGGSWSWARRPVIVSYNGRSIAASMNGMPHGEQLIKNNNFEGHFCVHFYNSKTHATNQIDSEHQSCVEQAYKSGN